MHNQGIHGPKIQISRENLIGNSDMHHGNFAFWMDDALPSRPASACRLRRPGFHTNPRLHACPRQRNQAVFSDVRISRSAFP
jgi:hypothetical protein